MFCTQFIDVHHILQMLDEMLELDTQKLYDIVLELPDIQARLSG